MLIICGTPQWISEQLLYVFINIVISTYMGSACDVPNKIVHLCDHHQKNYNLHDNEDNGVKYIASNGGEITYHNNDENEIEKLGPMDNHFLLDDIHTCYKNVTVLYLAGYDDEIFELRNDLLKKGEGNELIIYFFLYRDHKILNIGKIHTSVIFFDESILKYTHYYYLDTETVKNTFNKLRFENLEDNAPDEAINENKSKYFTVYPQKENDGYEFIIPKEKDIVMKDIIVDLNKNKDDKLNKPAGSTSIFTSSLLNQPNDNEIYYVDEDFLNACINSKCLKQKDKKNYMKKNQTLKSHMEISPPIQLESKTEDFLDEQSKSILSNTKRVLVPCNKISKDKSIKNFNHKDTTYYRLPKTLDSNTKTITDQVYSYKNPFSDVNVKGFNIVTPILLQGNRIDKNMNDNNRVRPNDSHYYLHAKPSDDILLNAEYDINKPNYKAFSHIHTSDQYIPNKKLPTKVVSKYTDTQIIKNIPLNCFRPLSSFSDGSYKNQDKILGSNVPYDNNYIFNPSYVTYKQNLKPLANKKYSTINPVIDFSTPVITSSSNIKINDKNKKIVSLPEAYSLYYRNSATQKKKYEPNKNLIHTLSKLNIPCQKLTNDKFRVLDADSTNILNIPRDMDISLINTNAKLSASPQVHGYHFYSSKYNINDKIKPEEIKAYPYYSKYNEPLPASHVPKLHATNRNFIPTTSYYLPREHSNLNKSVNYRLQSFKTFASSTNTPAQSKYDFISSQPDVYQPIRTKVYQPIENIPESSNMPMNGNPNIIHYVESGRLIPFLIKKDLNKPETSALPLQPSIELVRRKPPNIVLTSSEQKGAQATYESPLNVVICKNKYAIPNPNINIIKNLNFIKEASIPKLSTLNQDPYENASWFKKYQQNIPELLPYTKLSYFPKIKPSTKKPYQNSDTPLAPIYSSEIPKSPHNLISLTLAPVSPETIHMSQKPVNIIEFPSRNDLSISSKKFQSTQFVSIPKFNFTSNQLDIDLRSPIKKQKPSRFRPNIYQYPSKYHLSYLAYEPDIMSDTIFKLSQNVLKPNVPTLNREPASSYVFNNKNLPSLTKRSQHRFWPQNILTSDIAAMSERNKMSYRPKENFKEYLLKSYLSSRPQVATSPLLSLHEAIPNKSIIEEISPIPSYKKMFKVNKPDQSNIIFTLPQERLKSSIPIFNQESPTTKDTVCIKNLKLHTFPYVIKPLQYRNWPQNIITLPTTSPYIVPARNQAKKNLDQYSLKPYLSAKPQSVSNLYPASPFSIILLPTSTPEIKSSSRSPVPGIRNIPQSDITSQHEPVAEINKYLHLSKQNVNQYPPRSYSTPEAVTTKAFSMKSPITPLPRVSSSPNLPLYETVTKKQTNQGISPSYIKLYKLNDPDISTNTIFSSPFYMPNFNQKTPTATGTLSYKNLKVQTNPCIEKPSQYLNWPQNIISIDSPYILSPESIQKLHLPKQNLNLYPLKTYIAPQLQSEPVLAFPIPSQTTSIPAEQSSKQSPVSAIRSWPKNILTSSIASPHHTTTPERNKNLYLSKHNITQYLPKLYTKLYISKPLEVFIKSPIIICPEEMSSSSPLPLYETAPTNSIIQEISPIIEPAMSSNVIFTLPQQPLKLSLTNFNQESPATTDTLSNKNFELQTNPCVTNYVPSQYRDWPQNNIPSPITSPYVVTPERNNNLHLPMKNLNQFPLQPFLSPKLQSLRASSFPFTGLTHIPAVKSFLLLNKPTRKMILLNNSYKQPCKLNKPDTLSRTKFPLPKQYYKQNLLDISQEPVLSKHIFNLSYPKYITYKPKEVFSLLKQFSLPYDKFKVLPTNEYKSIPKSKLNTVPSISPLTITKIWSPKSKAYAPLFNTISASNQFSLRPEQRIPIIFFKPIDKNLSSPTMKSVLLTQPTFKNSLHLHPRRIPLPSSPSTIQYPYQHTSLDSNSLNISTKVNSISPIAIPRNNKLYSPYLLLKKVTQNKIAPKLSSSSSSLLENSLHFQIPTLQNTVSKAKLDNLPLSSIDKTSNKKHYPHFETLPFLNIKSILLNFKVPNQVIYISFSSNMNLNSPKSFITSKSPLITSSEPSKSDLPCILSSTLVYPLQKSVLPFTPLAQSLSEISPSQFRPAYGQSLNLPTERKLLKKLLTLPFKYDSISHHPHYEPVQTLDTESSVAHFNLPNKYKNILKSSYKIQNDLTYLTENQGPVSFNKDVINTQPTFSKVLNVHPHTNYLPSLKTLQLYPSYKPYTSTHIAKATNVFFPLQPKSNFIPFIKTPSYYQTERQGSSAPIHFPSPSYQSISVKNSPSRQFEPTSQSIPSKWSLLKTLQAPAASLFKSDLTSLSLPLLKSSSILSSYLHHPVYKTLPTLDSEIIISPPNLIKKSTWPLNKSNFTPKIFGKYQNYQLFNSQDRAILNRNNINTQPFMTPITKVASKSFNKFKLYPSFKPLNIQTFKAPFSISNVDTTNKHILLLPEPDSSYLEPSERTPIPDYYQTTSPNQLAWTKTIATGNSKDMGTLYHIQTSKSSANRQSLNTLKPNLAYSSPTISSPAQESYNSKENADFLINKASTFEKSSPSPLQLNFKVRSNMYPIYKGSKIKYFTSNTEIPSKIVNNLDTGKYDHINYLQKKPITKNQLYSNILYNNNNYKKNNPIKSSVNQQTHILSPLGTLNTNQDEFITDRERNLNIPIAKILQKSYKLDLGLREIITNNAINENIPSIRTQGMKQNRKEIPLPNISILKYDPREISNDVEIATDNPDIFIKAWTSRIEVIKPRIVYDTFQVQAYNFEPIVKELEKYDPNMVEGVVKAYVEKNYGEPIVLKGTYSFYKPYIISNVNNKYLKHGKIYLVWPTLCDCGCKCLGCQCYRKFYK